VANVPKNASHVVDVIREPVLPLTEPLELPLGLSLFMVGHAATKSPLLSKCPAHFPWLYSDTKDGAQAH
jgi:hypothetical protein